MQSEKKRVLSVASRVEDGDTNQQAGRLQKACFKTVKHSDIWANPVICLHLHTTEVQPLSEEWKNGVITTGPLAQALCISISK